MDKGETEMFCLLGSDEYRTLAIYKSNAIGELNVSEEIQEYGALEIVSVSHIMVILERGPLK